MWLLTISARFLLRHVQVQQRDVTFKSVCEVVAVASGPAVFASYGRAENLLIT